MNFDEKGLVPAVVQDARTGEVLMLAYMNQDALDKTLQTGSATFWSRSRNQLWVKGATSGNMQAVKSVSTDCDQDAILVRVDPAGPACHTGARSCFFEELSEGPPSAGETLGALQKTLEQRRTAPPEGSYTAKLYADENLRHKKIGEEATELVIASIKGDKTQIAGEAADLIFHAMVVLTAHGLSLDDVAAVLREREGKRRER